MSCECEGKEVRKEEGRARGDEGTKGGGRGKRKRKGGGEGGMAGKHCLTLCCSVAFDMPANLW